MTKSIYSEHHINVVKKLKTARIEAGLKQNEVAKLIGRTQSYISKIESGQRRIDVVQLKDLAKIYKQAFQYFLR